MKCNKCGCEANNQVLTPEGPHYGKVICENCKGWLAWLPRPALPIDPAKVPQQEPDAPLPPLTGASERQIAFGERCRVSMMLRSDLSPHLYSGMQTITEATFFIANHERPAKAIRWPKEWS